MGGRGASSVTGLPALTGSEKQVAWASEIRAGFIRTGEAVQSLYQLRRSGERLNPSQEGELIGGAESIAVLAGNKAGRLYGEKVEKTLARPNDWIEQRQQEILESNPQKADLREFKREASRRATAEYYSKVEKELQRVLKTQTNATFWIDSRRR